MQPTLLAEPAEAAGSGAPSIEIVSLEWQRIQVILRVRPTATAVVDPAAFRLQHADEEQAMPATRATLERSDIVLRFNVMQGPGQVPLSAGKWLLVVDEPDAPRGRPVVVTDPARLSCRTAARRFRLRRFMYLAVPAIDPADRSLSLHIRVRRRRRGGRRRRPLVRRFVRRVRRGPFGRVRLFQSLLRIVRLVSRRNGRRIVFASDSRRELGGNLKLVYDRMVERGLDRQYELMTVFKPSVTLRRSFLDRLRLAWRLGRADVIVIDDYHPVIYRLNDPQVRIIQLWHAVGSFKTVGYSRVGKPGAPDPYRKVHKNYTRAIVSSEHDVPLYAEAFGIPEDRVAPTGVPRMDRFFDPSHREVALEAAFREFPAARDRMTMLFAPTFRGHGARSARYDYDRLDLPALHAVCVEKDAVCIMRMHPFVREPLVIPPELGDRLLDGSSMKIDINDLLFAVDLLITDYSSIVFEFSTLGRPMLFYAYDLDEYIAGRDFYVPYREFVPGRIVRTFEELVDAIRRDDYEVEKVTRFAARYFDHLDGCSTDRVVDLILSG